MHYNMALIDKTNEINSGNKGNMSLSESDAVAAKISDLLANQHMFSKSMPNENDSDDDLFEDIAVNKNITFSRSRDEYEMSPVTPMKPKLNIDDKENQQCMESSFREGIEKDLCLRKKSQKMTPKSHTARDSTPRPNKSLQLITPPAHNLPMPELNSTENNKTLTMKCNKPTLERNEIEIMKNFDVSLNISNNLGATSTPTNSSSDHSKHGNLSFSNKRLSTPSSPLNSFLFQSRPTCTPPKSTCAPHISSMKKYSVMKAVISAKKDFENMVKSAELKRNSKRKGQNRPSLCLNITPETDRTIPINSSPNSPNIPLRSLACIQDVELNKTPLSIRKVEESRLVSTGIKQLVNNTIVKIPNTCHANNFNSQNSSNGHIEESDDDLPPTQPMSSILLRGIVAYVEIKSGKEYRSAGTKAELESLGAKVENNFTKKVTHCFFHGGKMSTYKRATEWNVPLVSTLWIEACKEEMTVVPLQGFKPYGLNKYKEELPHYRLKTRIRHPVTDSKIPSKPWKPANVSGKASQVTASHSVLPPVSNVQNKKVIEALHSVAGDIQKASHQFQQILTSPILRKASKQQNNCVENDTKNRKNSENNKKHNKKLNFSGLCKDKPTDTCGDISNRDNYVLINDEIRVSYDSDDMLAYAKKQAANARCSAPPRLLTSRKCKKLLSSCDKQPITVENKNKNSEKTTGSKHSGNKQASVSGLVTRRSKTQPSPKQNSGINRTQKEDEMSENIRKKRKRKLLLPSQTIAGFKQDSRESTPDLSNDCPYKVTPNKKPKAGVSSKTKRPMMLPPLMSVDWDSDDSLTRAARRESSALFVKKQKTVGSRCSIPTIVCTSLHRSDVDVVASIVSTLGTFVIEGTVSERTTHVITPSPRRTINLLKGIARGCWILNIKWIYESLESGKWLHEERFELLEFSPSVKQARVERQAFGPEFRLELFTGVGPIYVCRATTPPANELIELIRLCGGTVVSSARASKIVIGSSLPFSPIGRHPLMVKEKWVLDSISQLSQLNPHNYISIVPEP